MPHLRPRAARRWPAPRCAMPSRSTNSPGCGTRPSHSLISPPTVVDSISSSGWNDSQQVLHAGQVEIAGDDEAAAAILRHVARRLVLVADLADDHLQQVLHGGQAGGVAVLVHHDHHVGVLLLHLPHQRRAPAWFRGRTGWCAPARAPAGPRAPLRRFRTCRARARSRQSGRRSARKRECANTARESPAGAAARAWRRPGWRRCWAAASSLPAPPCRRTPPPIESARGPARRSALLRCPPKSALRYSPPAWAAPPRRLRRRPGRSATGRTSAPPRTAGPIHASARTSGTSGSSQRPEVRR